MYSFLHSLLERLKYALNYFCRSYFLYFNGIYLKNRIIQASRVFAQQITYNTLTDIDIEEPDEMSIMTYVASYHHYFSKVNLVCTCVCVHCVCIASILVGLYMYRYTLKMVPIIQVLISINCMSIIQVFHWSDIYYKSNRNTIESIPCTNPSYFVVKYTYSEHLFIFKNFTTQKLKVYSTQLSRSLAP